MSTFHPYSAGDYYAWEQAQRDTTPPPPPSEESLRYQREADAAWSRKASLDSHPGTPSLIASIVADLLRVRRDLVEAHVVPVEYRSGLVTATGSAKAFDVIPVGTFTVKARYDDRVQVELAIRADGKLFPRTNQAANVKMRSSMRWLEAPVLPTDTFARGTLVQRLVAMLPVDMRPDLDEFLMTPGPPTPPAATPPDTRPGRPVSRRARRKAARIRSNNLRTAVAVWDLRSALDGGDTIQHGPPTRHERKRRRELARLSAKSERALARADALDGGLKEG